MTEKQFVQRFLKRSVIKSQAFFQLPLLLVIINHTNIGHGADFSPNLLPQQVRNFRSSPNPNRKRDAIILMLILKAEYLSGSVQGRTGDLF
jgi:hypothetical protein